MSECASHVGKSFVTYPCTLEKGHDGPCMALENQPSVRQRKAWEETRHVLEHAMPQGGATRVVTHEALAASAEQVIDVTQPSPSDTLREARETLLAAAAGIEKLIAERATISGLLAEIEAALPEGAVDARSAASMLRAMLRV